MANAATRRTFSHSLRAGSRTAILCCHDARRHWSPAKPFSLRVRRRLRRERRPHHPEAAARLLSVPSRWRTRRRPLTGAREAGDRGLYSAQPD